jgi:hypothetical protein
MEKSSCSSDDSPKQSCARPLVYSQNNDDDSNMTPEVDNEEMSCPLFMVGLPSDFSTNPALAALASLLEEGEEDVKKKNPADPSHTMHAGGGGKVRRVKSREVRKAAPYHRSTTKQRTKDATIGEASLFLKMWKL